MSNEEWASIMRLTQAYGYLRGALEGLKWRVQDAETLKTIDEAMARAETLRLNGKALHSQDRGIHDTPDRGA